VPKAVDRSDWVTDVNLTLSLRLTIILTLTLSLTLTLPVKVFTRCGAKSREEQAYIFYVYFLLTL